MEKDLKIEKVGQFFFLLIFNIKYYETPLCGYRIVPCIHMDGPRELNGHTAGDLHMPKTWGSGKNPRE
jgi:hypothetical protein